MNWCILSASIDKAKWRRELSVQLSCHGMEEEELEHRVRGATKWGCMHGAKKEKSTENLDI